MLSALFFLYCMRRHIYVIMAEPVDRAFNLIPFGPRYTLQKRGSIVVCSKGIAMVCWRGRVAFFGGAALCCATFLLR